MRNSRVRFFALLTGAVLVPASASASGVPSGTYVGQGAGVKASVIVAESGAGTLKYAMKTPCGPGKGTLPLTGGPAGSLKGKSKARKAATVVRIAPSRDGSELEGTIRYAKLVTRKDGKRAKCRASRAFSAALDASTSPVVETLAGQYSGSGQDGGLPITFDVAFDEDAGRLVISNMNFDTNTECWEDYDGDGEDDTLVAKISGLGGEVESDGSFEIEYSPDDDTQYYVEGSLDEDGVATMDLEVSGYFAADGTPQSGGPFECDSFGETYVANRQG